MRGVGCNCSPIAGVAHGWEALMASGGITQREEVAARLFQIPSEEDWF